MGCHRKILGHHWVPADGCNYRCAICGSVKGSSYGHTYWQGPGGEKQVVAANRGPRPNRWTGKVMGR